MGDLTSTQMQAELARRVTQLSVGTGSAALAAINRAIRWVNRQGSYTFQLAGPSDLTVLTSTPVNAPSDLDPGKAMFLVNGTNGIGLPIERAILTDTWETRNFTSDFNDAGFDRYVLYAASVPPSVFHFFPNQSGTVTVTIRYHKLTVDLADGSGKSNLPRDFDDLVIDLAEAEERRINDIGETWQITFARCQDQIKLMLDAYKSMSMLPGLGSEAQATVTEKTQIGQP